MILGLSFNKYQQLNVCQGSGKYLCNLPYYQSFRHHFSNMCFGGTSLLSSIFLILAKAEICKDRTRHSFQGIGHTTYLCFARKAFLADLPENQLKNQKLLKTKKKLPTKTVKKSAKTTKKSTSKTVKNLLQKQPKNLLKKQPRNLLRHLTQNKIYSAIS